LHDILCIFVYMYIIYKLNCKYHSLVHRSKITIRTYRYKLGIWNNDFSNNLKKSILFKLLNLFLFLFYFFTTTRLIRCTNNAINVVRQTVTVYCILSCYIIIYFNDRVWRIEYSLKNSSPAAVYVCLLTTSWQHTHIICIYIYMFMCIFVFLCYENVIIRDNDVVSIEKLTSMFVHVWRHIIIIL